MISARTGSVLSDSKANKQSWGKVFISQPQYQTGLRYKSVNKSSSGVISIIPHFNCFYCLDPCQMAPTFKFCIQPASTIIFASSVPTTREPNASTLVSLCCRDNCAEYGSLQTTARIPANLFAVIEIPTPVPQIKMPPSASPPPPLEQLHWRNVDNQYAHQTTYLYRVPRFRVGLNA